MATALTDFLGLTRDSARAQWVQVAARQPRPRQEPFLPVEVLLSYALFFLFDPHRFGGGNMRLVPPEVMALARTFQRPPGSIVRKMLNLDFSSKNCAKYEPELYSHLARHEDEFASLYLIVIMAARDVGLGDDQVPDVIARSVPDGPALLGQDELGSLELGKALDEQRETIDLLQRSFGLGELQTTRLVEQRVRLGQHRFAASVLSNYEYQCGFCGFAPRSLRKHRLLVASHIKPWRDSSSHERLDPRNGIAACPLHDSAFDGGLITVNGGLRIRRSDMLDASMVSDQGVGRYFEEPVLHDALFVPAGKERPSPAYLAWHKEYVFAGTLSEIIKTATS